MAPRVEFRRVVEDAAGLEGRARIGLGPTGFKGDDDRLFLPFGEPGLLLSRDDARAFLAAARRAGETLGHEG